MKNENSIGEIVTHNGVFHADDCFAVGALRVLHPDSRVVRTRDPKEWLRAAYLVDVGGEYDPERGRFDHHQKGGAGVRPNDVPYASFGLVWNALGEGVILDVLDIGGMHHADIQEIKSLVDERLVQGVDAADCGYRPQLVLRQGDGQGSGASVAGWENGPGLEGVEFDGAYNAEHTAHTIPPCPGAGMTISQLISSLNPTWDEEAEFDVEFEKAVEIAGIGLRREIRRAASEVKARALVREAIDHSQHGDPRVLVLDRFLPWQETVIEEAPAVEFVVFPAETGDWRVQTVPLQPGSFTPRKPLPKEWWGLRGGDLDALTGMEGCCVFCHPNGFIAGTVDQGTALAMANEALGSAVEG